MAHKANIATAIGLFIGGLSLTEQISFVLGALALLVAIVVNIIAIKNKAHERKWFKIKTELAQEQLKKLRDE